ncbi:four-helix bundle copper-binding protein [Pedobacter immunditicola]|uniref:four-helix bundle copper-binding protein n=1 Tax=Pedobacter immunditicola TaxID=3133440 RepID=UPI003099FD9D
MSPQRFQDSIQACVACVVACSHCATECLKEQDVRLLSRFIQLDLECEAIFRSAAEVMSLGGTGSEALCRVCADFCNNCAEECGKHAEMGTEYCRMCAEACRSCAESCEQMSIAA